MVLSLENNNGDVIMLDEDLYDFKTDNFEQENIKEPVNSEEVIDEEPVNSGEVIDEENLELKSAKENKDVESVALNATETPVT